MAELLFICKRREGYAGHGVWLSSGLRNSAQMCVDMLNGAGLSAELVEVVDNNDIDREVARTRPRVVIIEALWVVPEKFEVLQKLWPRVTWVVRLHSELSFLSTEGIAMQWVLGYLDHPNVRVAGNSREAVHQLRAIVAAAKPKLEEMEVHGKVLSLPNYYPLGDPALKIFRAAKFLDVGCFGALRPLKNQLMQAAAAIRYAERAGRVLRFHINGSRCEQGGGTVLENLRALFHHERHSLVEHEWLNHAEFVALLGAMDASMCVSLSETFCIVAADTVAAGVPLLCSREVPWAWEGALAEPTVLESVAAGLGRVLDYEFGQKCHQHNVANLRASNIDAQFQWLHAFAPVGIGAAR